MNIADHMMDIDGLPQRMNYVRHLSVSAEDFQGLGYGRLYLRGTGCGA